MVVTVTDIDTVAQRSAQVVNTDQDSVDGLSALDRALIMWVGGVADEIVPWGTNVQLRDAQLRAFYKTEAVLLSAISIITARNQAMEWELTGPKSTVAACHEMMQEANFGRGMLNFVQKLCIDLYTQDKGAFIELIRDGDSETSPVIGFANLDADKCIVTRNPKFPVIYTDRDGKTHKLPWYSVYHMTEMETPSETPFAIQLSAVSRVLRYAQNHRNYIQYESEKVSGRNQRAIHLVSGIGAEKIQNAVKGAADNADNQGLTRYIQPAIVASMDPNAQVSVATLELASLPSGFDQTENFKQYLTIIAMALLTDYLELAPLPGGGLGSATQVDKLDKKSQAKGAEVFRKLVAQFFNNSGVLPRNVEFSWVDNDFDAESTKATLALARAQARQQMQTNGEIDVRASLQLALDTGDIPQEVYDYMIAKLDAEEKEAAAKPADTTPPTAETDAEENDMTGTVVAENENPDAQPEPEDGDIAQQTTSQENNPAQKSAKRRYNPFGFAALPRR